jgi:hypothetical protein
VGSRRSRRRSARTCAGFGLEDGHIQRPERLSRPIPVMALALFWPVSTGVWHAVHDATPDEKKRRTGDPATCCAA